MPRLTQVQRYVERGLLYNVSLRNAIVIVLRDIVQIQNSSSEINTNLRKLKRQLASLYHMICVTEIEILTDNET